MDKRERIAKALQKSVDFQSRTIPWDELADAAIAAYESEEEEPKSLVEQMAIYLYEGQGKILTKHFHILDMEDMRELFKSAISVLRENAHTRLVSFLFPYNFHAADKYFRQGIIDALLGPEQ